MRETEHFSNEELKCKCGCGQNEMSVSFLHKLEVMRCMTGPLTLTSAYRCEKHPVEAAKGTVGGPHTTGHAVDIACTDSKMRMKIIKAAIAVGMTGIGVSKSFIHVDDLENDLRPNVWVY